MKPRQYPEPPGQLLHCSLDEERSECWENSA
ncbi:hypothetical protein D0Y56_17195 [Pseudomonas aeruginosa]|nr:hypothetical protein D0Y56_17195 [Pseudomonas aeruginosa]